MAGVSKEQIEQARRLDLLTYLRAYEPGELIKSGSHEFRTKTHHSLVISNGLWHWKNGGIGGVSALDYLVKVRRMNFVEAVHLLDDGREIRSPPAPVTTIPYKKPLQLPKASSTPLHLVPYLQKRGIDKEIIKTCLEQKTLYESQNYHNCVFVGKDRTGKPCSAFMRGTIGDFKQDAPGSSKKYGFALAGKGQELLLFESAIDCLSHATLDKLSGNEWRQRHYLSLGGTSPLAAVQYLKDHPDIKLIRLCLDNDEAGIRGMIRVQAALKKEACSREVKIIACPPPTPGKDFNDVLRDKAAHLEKQKVTHERGYLL